MVKLILINFYVSGSQFLVFVTKSFVFHVTCSMDPFTLLIKKMTSCFSKTDDSSIVYHRLRAYPA